MAQNKAKYAEFLQHDYAQASDLTKDSTVTVDNNREDIDRHFYSTAYDDVPLANKDGAIYLQQLVHYIAGTLLPSSGEWINIDTTGITNAELLKQIADVRQYLAGTISQTNFYKQITMVIYNALLYNKAIIEPQYSAGLSFAVHDHDTLAVTDLGDDLSNRAYSEKERTVDELRQLYKNVPKDLEPTTEDEATSTVRVLKCLVPNRDPFVMGKADGKKDYKFVQIEVLLGDDPVILEPRAPSAGYSVFPIISFQPHGKESLAALALPAAVLANKFAKALDERSDIANHPPIGMSAATELRNAYDLSAGGIVPIDTGEVEPKPIATTLDLVVSEKSIAQQQQIIRTVFKIDYIVRSQLANLSQYEYNQNRYNALNAIEPLVADFANKGIPAVLKRLHIILKSQDSKYKELASNLEPQFMFTHLNKQLAEAKELAKLGHLAQLITPFGQLDPKALMALDVNKIIAKGATLSGNADAVRSESDQQEMQQSMVEQQQQQQAEEQETERLSATKGGEGAVQ